MKLSVFLPAYQEAENLRALLPALTEALRGADISHEILVVDTAEPLDDTPELCAALGARCVPRRGGDSYGDAVRTGFAEARGEYTVVMDADGSHRPEDAVRLLREMERGGADVVIGSRYCPGGRTDNPLPLLLMSRALNLSYSLAFRLKIRDVSDSFRVYRTEDLRSLRLECDNFDVVEEILIRLSLDKPDFTAREIPIAFCKRAAGQSKRKLGRFILSYLRTMDRLLKIRREHLRMQRGAGL